MFAQVILCAAMLVSCDNDTDWEAKMQEAIAKGEYTEARACAAKLSCGTKEAYEKITRAQVTFLMNTGSVDQAYSIAQEEGTAFIFFESFMPKLSEVNQNIGKMKVLEYLSKVEFEAAADLSAEYCNDYNDTYNEGAAKYNSLLEQFINLVDIQGDKTFVAQLMKFVKPIVVEIKKSNGVSDGVKLSNQPLEDIKKRLSL